MAINLRFETSLLGVLSSTALLEMRSCLNFFWQQFTKTRPGAWQNPYPLAVSDWKKRFSNVTVRKENVSDRVGSICERAQLVRDGKEKNERYKKGKGLRRHKRCSKSTWLFYTERITWQKEKEKTYPINILCFVVSHSKR